MRILPVMTAKSFNDFEKENKIRVKIEWVKNKKYLYMNREDKRLLEGMEVMGNWILKEIFGKEI